MTKRFYVDERNGEFAIVWHGGLRFSSLRGRHRHQRCPLEIVGMTRPAASTKEYSTHSRHSGVARSAIMNFKKGRNTIKPRTLRKLTKAIRDLQD